MSLSYGLVKSKFLEKDQGAANVGKVMKVGADGTLSPQTEGGGGYTLPTASTTEKGGVKVGDGLAMDEEALTLNESTQEALGLAATALQSVPAASASTLGGVKVGSGLSVASDGTLSATGSGAGGFDATGVAEEYSSSATYAVGDLCTYNNKLWRCSTAISAAEAWTAGHWTETCVSDEFNRMANIVVTAVTQDGVTVTGQTVTVREGGASGQVYTTGAYNGQPITFAVPKGFVYYISISDTLASHFNPTTASGIVTANTVSVTLTYSDFSNIQNFQDIKAALDSGLDLTDLVGESVSNTRQGTTISWDVADYTNDTITLLTTDILRNGFRFEPPQATFYCNPTAYPNGLAAGNYSFVNSSTTYYFTTTATVPSGGQIRATTSTWDIYASPETSASLASGSVSTTEISGATSLGTCGTELNHMDRINYGSNNNGESLAHRWLNSNAGANEAIAAANKYSRAYIPSDGGFLNGFDAEELAVVDDTVWNCTANNVYEAPASVGGISVRGQSYNVTSKFALCRLADIGLGGAANWSLFVGATNEDRIKKWNGSAQDWWVRDCNSGHASNECVVTSAGGSGYSNAYVSDGLVAACKISKSV